MKLTVGMAHYEDYHGAFFTTLNILGDHLWQSSTEIELLIVDNGPAASKHSTELAKFAGQLAGHGENVRLIRHDAPPSTSGARQRIFEEATGDIVLVVDCHVKPSLFALNRLVQWFRQNPESLDLVSGPMMHTQFARLLNAPELPRRGNASVYESHFDPVWRSEMFGVWACDLRARHVDAPPFDVPGMGLGLFACRREAWPGFNPHCQGFGGEELYIHEKIRRNGGRVLCLPFMRWLHRFGRPDGVPYPLTRFNKVRNYVLEFQELGWPLDPIHAHFVDRGENLSDDELRAHLVAEHSQPAAELAKFGRDVLDQIHGRFKLPAEEWDWLLADPIRRRAPLHAAPIRSFGFDLPPPINPSGDPISVPEIFDWLQINARRDLQPLLPRLKALGDSVQSVIEFTARRESSIAWLASTVRSVRTFTTEPDTLLALADKTVDAGRWAIRRGIAPADVDPMEPAELVYIDGAWSADAMRAALRVAVPSSSRYLLIRGTLAFGFVAANANGIAAPGILDAMRPLIDGEQWFVVWHDESTPEGLALLSCNPADRPARPQYLWPPGHGPGSELRSILSGLGIIEKPNCDCKAFAATMDRWGVDGCESRRAEIVAKIKGNAARWGWGGIGDLLRPAASADELTVGEKVTAAWRSVRSGLAFRVNPLDPFPGLVDEAIRRATAASKA